MGLFDKFKSKFQDQSILMETDPSCVYVPVKGEIIPLAEIGDGVFSKEILGKGCGIRPSDEKVFAPFDGKVSQIAQTKHAIGLVSNSGIEVLIHIGMDTVEMNGVGFKPVVHVGDEVRCGQLLMTYSISAIEAAGHSSTTAVVVANSDQYTDVQILGAGSKQVSEKLIQVN